MRYILDASFFFGEYPFCGEFATTPEVVAELRDVTSKMRFEVMQSRGLVITDLKPPAVTKARDAPTRPVNVRTSSHTVITFLAVLLSLSVLLLCAPSP